MSLEAEAALKKLGDRLDDLPGKGLVGQLIFLRGRGALDGELTNAPQVGPSG